MKISNIVLCAILSVTALLSCSTDGSSDTQKNQMELSSTVIGTSDGVSEFIALQKNFTSGYDTDTCYNITPQHISDNSDFRIFKYDNSCASFLLYDNEIYALGAWFGGFGVTDARLCDIDGDSVMELYFTFSSGSGMHRSQAGYFNPDVKEVVIFDYSHMNADMMIVVNDSGGLCLYEATIPTSESFVNFTIEANKYIADIVLENYSEVTLLFPK